MRAGVCNTIMSAVLTRPPPPPPPLFFPLSWLAALTSRCTPAQAPGIPRAASSCVPPPCNRPSCDEGATRRGGGRGRDPVRGHLAAGRRSHQTESSAWSACNNVAYQKKKKTNLEWTSEHAMLLLPEQTTSPPHHGAAALLRDDRRR